MTLGQTPDKTKTPSAMAGFFFFLATGTEGGKKPDVVTRLLMAAKHAVNEAWLLRWGNVRQPSAA